MEHFRRLLRAAIPMGVRRADGAGLGIEHILIVIIFVILWIDGAARMFAR